MGFLGDPERLTFIRDPHQLLLTTGPWGLQWSKHPEEVAAGELKSTEEEAK